MQVSVSRSPYNEAASKEVTLGWDLRGLRYGREKNDVGPGMSGD